MKEVQYKGWNAVELATSAARLVIPRDIGPRVIDFGLQGQANLFLNRDEEMGRSGETQFQMRGGHRFWIAPEHPVRTPELDNAAIGIEAVGEQGVLLKSPLDSTNRTYKEIELSFISERTVRVEHRVTNKNAWPIEIAPWALSVMNIGGYLTIPLPAKRPFGPQDLLPSNALILWPYTDFSASQWEFHPSFIGVDAVGTIPVQKMGVRQTAHWAAYWQPEGTFIKAFRPLPGASYPDEGSTFETYFCHEFLEVESLGTFGAVAPDQTVSHLEYWGLLAGLPKPDSEEMFQQSLRPAAEAWLRQLPA